MEMKKIKNSQDTVEENWENNNKVLSTLLKFIVGKTVC